MKCQNEFINHFCRVGVDMHGSHSTIFVPYKLFRPWRRKTMTLQKIPSVAGSLSVDSDDSKKMRSSIHRISIAVAFGVIAVLLGLYGFVYVIDSILPTSLSLADEVGKSGSFARK
jgi:hypothetical protein